MKLYDKGKILGGLAVFLVVIAIPFWYSPGPAKAPELSLDTPRIGAMPEKVCIYAASVMRARHVEILEEWKRLVVREGNRIYTGSDGRKHEMSLTGTCLGCHSNKEKFCDRCHDHVGVKPNCYSCHVLPKEVKQ